jgi:pilus assembly protein CpaF
MPKLIVIDKTGNQTHFPFEKDRITIGKGPANDVVLNEAEVSREHCVIAREGAGYGVTDLNSANGVYVNGSRIRGSAGLRDGARIGVGRYLVMFRADSAVRAGTGAGKAAVPAAGATGGQKAPAVKPPADKVKALAAYKEKVHKTLLESVDLKKVDFAGHSQDELKQKTRSTVEAIVKSTMKDLPADIDRDRLINEVVDEAVGLGPLEELLKDDSITEIMVNNWDRIYIERNGRIVKTERRFTNNQQVMAIIRRVIAPIGRRIDESSPMVDARLPDGSRVNAIIHPLSLTGPTVTIRKFSREPFKVKDLIGFGTLSREMADFLKMTVKYKQNILISGGTGSGKTTLLNVVSLFIPHDERIVTIEDSAELKLNQEHVVSLETKPPNIEGKGAIPIRKLVINSLRMRPDRIIVGECRGAEALDMLQAMNTGHEGSLTTLHANSARDALNRLETMVLMAGMELPIRAIRDQVAGAIDILVHTARLTDGARKIISVSEITGMEGDVITMQDIFVFKQTGITAEGKIIGKMTATGVVPKFVLLLKQRGLPVDLSLFRKTA